MYVLMSLTSQVPFYTPGPSVVIRVSGQCKVSLETFLSETKDSTGTLLC
jgi:hypothetical protein